MQGQLNVFDRTGKIRILKESIFYFKIDIISRQLLRSIGAFYKTFKLCQAARYYFIKILLVNPRYQGKDFFKLIGRSFEPDIHSIDTVIQHLKETFRI